MTEQWQKDDARLAEELGWRRLPSTVVHTSGCWVAAFGCKSAAQWQIRCVKEAEYWVVPERHHWGNPPKGQPDTLGPFASFLEAATTYQLTQGEA